MAPSRARRLPLVSLALCLACAASAEGDRPAAGKAVAPGDHVFSLEHGGRTRSYVVHVPPSYDASRPTPVVLSFHGGAGRPDTQIRETQLNAKSDSAGFLAVYPEGTGPRVLGRLIGTWNAGRCCGYAAENRVDDVGFVSRLLDDLSSRFALDPKRIYATGHSNGALMAYRLACELSDRIAAVAANAGHDAFDGCRPSRPVPILHFHGTADPSAHYEGGHCGGRMGDPGWACSPVPDFAASWRARNGCKGPLVESYARGDASCVSSGPCEAGSEVVLCTIRGGGHTWPGGAYAKDTAWWKKAVGPLSRDISANDVLWEFFQRHPMP